MAEKRIFSWDLQPISNIHKDRFENSKKTELLFIDEQNSIHHVIFNNFQFEIRTFTSKPPFP